MTKRLTAKELTQEWEKRQEAGCYQTYRESMDGLAALIMEHFVSRADFDFVKGKDGLSHDIICEPDVQPETYRERQISLRAAGFNAYNCDEVDEFPKW